MILWIVRHGKAERHSASGADFDRPLRDRGRRQAKWLGTQFAQRTDGPGQLFSSPALRARETAEIVAAALDTEVTFDDRLKVDEPADGVIDLLTEFAVSRHGTPIALFGHNPQLSTLASALGSTDIALQTGQAAAIELPGAIERGAGALLDLLRLDD